MKKVADRQTELFAEIQFMRKDMSSEFVKHNSSQNDFRKQLQVKFSCNCIKRLYTVYTYILYTYTFLYLPDIFKYYNNNFKYDCSLSVGRPLCILHNT